MTCTHPPTRSPSGALPGKSGIPEAVLSSNLSLHSIALPPSHPLPGKSGIFEAVLSSNLSHPNIVHTYQYAFRPVTVSSAVYLPSAVFAQSGTDVCPRLPWRAFGPVAMATQLLCSRAVWVILLRLVRTTEQA